MRRKKRTLIEEAKFRIALSKLVKIAPIDRTENKPIIVEVGGVKYKIIEPKSELKQ